MFFLDSSLVFENFGESLFECTNMPPVETFSLDEMYLCICATKVLQLHNLVLLFKGEDFSVISRSESKPRDIQSYSGRWRWVINVLFWMLKCLCGQSFSVCQLCKCARVIVRHDTMNSLYITMKTMLLYHNLNLVKALNPTIGIPLENDCILYSL